jgi:hypothetical protein
MMQLTRGWMRKFLLVEGLDDTVDEHPVRQCRTNNGVCPRNANIDFGAGRNDPAARFHHLTRAFSLLDALTKAVISFVGKQIRKYAKEPLGTIFFGWCLL